MRSGFGVIMAGVALAGLAACVPGEEGVDAGGIEPPAVDQEVPMEAFEMPEMPTPEEAAAAAAEAQVKAEEGVIYAGAGKNGGAVSVPAGEILRIELLTVPTAGYIWQIVEKPDFLSLVAENTRPTDPAYQNLPGFTGGNHFMSFDLEARAAGTGTIRLIEGRPWETDEPPEATYELTVTAAGE
ncbi:MAG: protease inhibitor I42 family protein [Hyphomonas sp.]